MASTRSIDRLEWGGFPMPSNRRKARMIAVAGPRPPGDLAPGPARARPGRSPTCSPGTARARPMKLPPMDKPFTIKPSRT